MPTPPVTSDVDRPTLLVCRFDRLAPRLHPCARAAAALEAAGVDHVRRVYGAGRPFGLGTTGRRPDLEAVSGQEKLPVLVLPGGGSVAGSDAIVAWARERGPDAAR